MLLGFAPGILIAVLLYLDKTNSGKTHINKTNIAAKTTIRTAPRAEVRHTAGAKKIITRQPRKSVEGDNDKIKYTFYLKLLRDEKIVGDRQIKRETKKYQQQLRKRKRAERKRQRKRIKQRKARLARKKKNAQTSRKRTNKNSIIRRSKIRNAHNKSTNKFRSKTNNLGKKKRKKARLKQRKNKVVNKRQKKSQRNVFRTKKKSKPFPDYILIQAGSFRQKKQANQHRATLATYGVNSAISSATIKGEMWYRVRVGPFQSYKEMKSKLSQLRKKKIQVMPIRVGKRKQ